VRGFSFSNLRSRMMLLAIIPILALIVFFLRQIRTLLDASHRFTTGDLNVRDGIAKESGELGQLNHSLDEMVTTRTAKLVSVVSQLEQEIGERERIEAELQQAKRAAEAANRAKSEFLTHMSHEFRTPLNGIMGYAQLLQREARRHGDVDLAWWQEGLTIIQRSGEHLLNLVNDILDLSRIEAGRLELHPVAFHLNEFLQIIADMGRIQAEEKRLAFEYNLASPLPAMVVGDPRRLRQILLNLLGNAVKFTEQGQVTFTVGAISPDGEEGSDTLFRFEAADTGIGIAPQQLEEIFQPFRRVDEQHYFEGAGLGLPISRELAELMGGELHVQSQPGRGSVFWLDVRLADVADWVEPANGNQIVGYHGDRRKILVIDDNRDNRAILVSLLATLGFEVAEAVDGTDGLRQAEAFRPDLILLDLIMPELSGLDVVRQIRQSSTLKEIVVIAVSASAFGVTRQQSLAAGCNDFLAKPVDIALVLDMLQHFLRLTWVYDEAGRRGAEELGEIFPSVPQFLYPSTSLIGPPPGEAALLFELALIGDVGEIRARVNRLEQVDERLAPFATVVRHMAKAFELEKICDLVKLYMEEGYGT
jgi:signal transduction histidine kinase/ActR/RegA family two-component response regulator